MNDQKSPQEIEEKSPEEIKEERAQEKERKFYKELCELYPLGLITRKGVSEYTGGLYSHRTLGKLDNDGTGRGIKDAKLVNGRMVYEIAEVAKWLARK